MKGLNSEKKIYEYIILVSMFLLGMYFSRYTNQRFMYVTLIVNFMLMYFFKNRKEIYVYNALNIVNSFLLGVLFKFAFLS